MMREDTMRTVTGSTVVRTIRSTTHRSHCSNFSVLMTCRHLLVMVVALTLVTVTRADYIVSEFSEQSKTSQFLHLQVDPDNGGVYVGAKNWLYRLDPNLRRREAVSTGPKPDNPKCTRDKCPIGEEQRLMDNYNKVLVLDRERGRVLTCGSLFQGGCEVRGLFNISRLIKQPDKAVAANKAGASTVAFIAPGPPDNSQVLYVAVTYTDSTIYRDEVPAVASRSLDDNDLLEICHQSVTSGTRVSFNSLQRTSYQVNYVTGFHSDGFSYIVTTQKRGVNNDRSGYISKLVRVCDRDSHYHSYTEIPIKCVDNKGVYNLAQAVYVTKAGRRLAEKLGIGADEDVLFGVFAKSSTSSDNVPSSHSALCVFSMKSVREKFTYNILKCYRGEGWLGLGFISDARCQHTLPNLYSTITDDFCGLDVNTPIGGKEAVTAVAALTFSSQLTSILAQAVGDFTVVFIGTHNGHVKKVAVETGRSGTSRSVIAQEYADLVVREGSPVRRDMLFDTQKRHIYVMTERMVSKVKVQQCHLYSTCSDCLGVRDPYCGWCSLENKCSVRSDCRDAAKDPLYWVNYKSDRCTTIRSVEPKQLQSTTVRTLTLSIDNLPRLHKEGSFLCVFSVMGKTLLTNATQTKNAFETLACSTPRTDVLPEIPQGQHFMTAKLSVRISGGPDFVAVDFAFYNCHRYTKCSQCVDSPFPCDWCVDGNRCTHDTAENCRNDILINGVKRLGPSVRSGPSHCPRIISTRDRQTEVLVPAETSRQVIVQVENIPAKVVQGNFVCQFNVQGRVMQTGATLLGTNVHCKEMHFNYNGPQPNISVTFAVIWNHNKALDNPSNVHITVYRCANVADNCGECLTLSPRLQCGWCSRGASDTTNTDLTTSGSCQVESICLVGGGSGGRGADLRSGSRGVVGLNWLNRYQTCPNPQILDFEPKSGPYEGNTNITIYGVNLGKSFDDIHNQITVDDLECIPFRHLYVKTRKIVCRVDTPGSNKYRNGPIVVRVSQFLANSSVNYEFVDPRLTDIQPRRGPRSGGTRVQISGHHIDAGSMARAFIGQRPCRIVERGRGSVVCLTGDTPHTTVGRVSVEFDEALRYLSGINFAYVQDPIVEVVYSGAADEVNGSGSAGTTTGVAPGQKNGGLRGIPSGGVRVTVFGSNLLVIAQPRMVVNFMGVDHTSPCHVLSDKLMECRSPALSNFPDPRGIDPGRPVSLSYGFIMDNVESVRNLTKSMNERFLLYPDPVFQPFDGPDGVKQHNSDYLIIDGHNLNLACQESDLVVHIGTELCNVTSLSLNQLTCKPPSNQPDAVGPDGLPDNQQLPQIIVSVGNDLNYTLGRLSYAGLTGENAVLPKPAVVGVAVTAILLVTLVICVLIVFKRKSSENSRVLKNMQEQMDVLELRVAAECKEAFAELQTEMTDLTSDITGLGIPFLDYRTYCMKILFPSQDGHPVLQWGSSPEMQRREKGLRLFGQLVINKTFLLIFIRTLESNRQFSMRDRVNVASLIMVTLQSRMEYCTDILKTLLSELIERCTEPNGSHPKLLLRRTESVAEKMLSAWFTFLLYKFMRECAGEPLYLLYRAIKQQVEKGPVDAVTGEARYSLSENKLIRQQVEFFNMTVYVSMPSQTVYVSGLDPHQDNVDIPVRVLSTDTISQIKEKSLDAIYRSTPFSMRPRKEDLDLQWRTGASGRLVLFDEDSTTKLEAGWKKLNTLAHYRVPDGALLTLVPKQTPIYNLSLLSDKSDKSHKYETLNLVKYGLGGGGVHNSGGGGMGFGGLLGNSNSPSLGRGLSPVHHDLGEKVWHLARHCDSEHRDSGNGSCERTSKMVSEIYLTRLLATKGTLQKFMDDLFETIFSTAHRGSALPLAIKYMFDFLDDQSLQHGIFDPDTVHTWKSNSLPLRFWVNLIKNPNFVFDINKSTIVDSCLSVVAQTFMDSCSTSENKLGKDSPSSKLLYAKDIPIYKEWVIKYYEDIKMMPSISDQDMNAMLAEESRLHQQEFNTNCALHELYAYAVKYSDQLAMNLDEDEFSRRQRLALKLDQVHKIMAGGSDQ